MDHLAIQILAFVKANPGWAIFVIGLSAFGESFVFLSLLFPGTAILIAAGTLVSEGILNPLPTVVAGIAGAVLGDLVSFWLGQRFGPLLPKIWPFRRNPERLTRGISFFECYGVSSVFIGRFFGPLRAVVPLAAGMMHMSPSRFYTANVLSAVVWVPALVVFGDLLTRSLGTKIVHVTFVAAAVTALFFWIRRQFLVGWQCQVSFWRVADPTRWVGVTSVIDPKGTPQKKPRSAARAHPVKRHTALSYLALSIREAITKHRQATL